MTSCEHKDLWDKSSMCVCIHSYFNVNEEKFFKMEREIGSTCIKSVRNLEDFHFEIAHPEVRIKAIVDLLKNIPFQRVNTKEISEELSRTYKDACGTYCKECKTSLDDLPQEIIGGPGIKCSHFSLGRRNQIRKTVLEYLEEKLSKYCNVEECKRDEKEMSYTAERPPFIEYIYYFRFGAEDKIRVITGMLEDLPIYLIIL